MTSTISEPDVHDLIIIGSGPAGYTAALYAARAQLTPVVLEGFERGGALMTTTEVENFPGFTDGIDGTELMERLRAQAARFGARLVEEHVDRVDLDRPLKQVCVGDTTYRAKAVILSMGAATRYLGIPGEHDYLGRGVSSCATCDGYFFRDKHVVVVGGGDSAMEEATFLTRFAAHVTVIHRSETIRASRIMLERARSNPKISWMLNTEVVAVTGDADVDQLRVRDRSTGAESDLPASAMFVAIGHEPRSLLVRDQVETDAQGYVQTTARSSATNLSGVFAAGDLVDHTYRQAITAAGSGCTAAIDAERWLAAIH